jgi:hypothetical protein
MVNPTVTANPAAKSTLRMLEVLSTLLVNMALAPPAPRAELSGKSATVWVGPP